MQDSSRWVIYLNPNFKQYFFTANSQMDEEGRHSDLPFLGKALDGNKQECWVFATHGVVDNFVNNNVLGVQFNDSVMWENPKDNKVLRKELHGAKKIIKTHKHLSYDDKPYLHVTGYDAIAALLIKNRAMLHLMGVNKVYMLNCYNAHFNTFRLKDSFLKAGITLEPYTSSMVPVSPVKIYNAPVFNHGGPKQLHLLYHLYDEKGWAHSQTVDIKRNFLYTLYKCISRPHAHVPLSNFHDALSVVSLSYSDGVLSLYINDDFIAEINNHLSRADNLSTILSKGEQWCDIIMNITMGESKNNQRIKWPSVDIKNQQYLTLLTQVLKHK